MSSPMMRRPAFKHCAQCADRNACYKQGWPELRVNECLLRPVREEVPVPDLEFTLDEVPELDF